MLKLPEILYNEKYDEFWTWDGWKPKAKPNAPQELKQAIAKFVADAESDDGEGGIVFK